MSFENWDQSLNISISNRSFISTCCFLYFFISLVIPLIIISISFVIYFGKNIISILKYSSCSDHLSLYPSQIFNEAFGQSHPKKLFFPHYISTYFWQKIAIKKSWHECGEYGQSIFIIYFHLFLLKENILFIIIQLFVILSKCL